MTPEQQRLQEFMEAHFDFDSLKQMGFWLKGTRRADYARQAARVCDYFGFQTVYEYAAWAPRGVRECPDTHTVTGKMPDAVTPAGELRTGGGFLLDCGPPTVFACPVCTCPQDAEDHARFRRTPEHAPVRCTGCKRKLVLHYPPFGPGALEVWEA